LKIVYYCYGGAHSSVIAASIHVGMLPTKRIAKKKEIISIPYFDLTPNSQIGLPLYIGIDSWGNEIYCMGWGIFKERILSSILLLKNKDRKFIFDSIIFVYALPVANIFIRLGGFLSRRIGLISIGRPLVIIGVRKRYYEFVELVSKVKEHNIRKNLI
jgi:hypothetical protein